MVSVRLDVSNSNELCGLRGRLLFYLIKPLQYLHSGWLGLKDKSDYYVKSVYISSKICFCQIDLQIVLKASYVLAYSSLTFLTHILQNVN